MKTNNMLPFGAIALFASLSPISAALITWGTATQIDDAGTFVTTTGTLVAAINADDNGDNATIGGVTFLGNNVTNWNAGISGAGGITIASNSTNGNYGSTFVQGGGPPPTITDSNINNLIGSALWNPQSVTLSNLTVGDTYIIQIIGNDSRDGRHSNFVSVLTDGVNGAATGANGLNPLSNTSPTGANPRLPGSEITGTFVADAATQTFNIFGSTNGGSSNNSGGRAQINGFQLRTVPVPEPSSALLAGIASMGLLRRRR